MAGGIKIMSRKTLMTILAIFGAVFAFVSKEFGLEIDTVGFMGMAVSVLLWAGFEARLDMKRIVEAVGAQSSKFKDAKFWLAFVQMMITTLNEVFSWNLPIEIIISVLTAIMGILFVKDRNKVASGDPA